MCLLNTLFNIVLILLFDKVLRVSRSISPWYGIYSLSRIVGQTFTRLTIHFKLAVELKGGGAGLRTLFGHTKRWLGYKLSWSSARLRFKGRINKLLLIQSQILVLLGEVPILANFSFLNRSIGIIKHYLVPLIFLILSNICSNHIFSFHYPCINRWGVFWDSVLSLPNSLSLLPSNTAVIWFMLNPLKTEQLRMH